MNTEEYHNLANEIWNTAMNRLDYFYKDECSNQSCEILDYRFGHTVWADFNYESWNIQWCIDQQSNQEYDEMHPFEKEVLIWSLEKLRDSLPKYEDCIDYKQLNFKTKGSKL